MEFFDHFTVANVCAVGAGTVLLWCKLGKNGLTVWGLGKLWKMIGLDGKARDVFELVSFVVFGIFVGIAFAQPATVQQAFTAGLGWTGLLTISKR